MKFWKSKRLKFSGVTTFAGILVIFLALYLLVTYLSGINDFEIDPANTAKVNLYFVNISSKQLQGESRKINKGGGVEDFVRTIIAELAAGPKTSGLERCIPSTVTILNIRIVSTSGTAEVTLSNSFNETSTVEQVLVTSALVWTLTEVDAIENVKFYLGDKEATKASGAPLGLLNRDNVVISPNQPSIDAGTVNKEILLYFADPQALGLIAEKRVIAVNPNHPIEKYIVAELIKGPDDKNLQRTIAPETKINNVKTDNGVCYVDLSREFVSRLDSSANERLAVYAIVNSLTELSKNITKVQIWIEGNKVVESNLDISVPLERDESVILAS